MQAEHEYKLAETGRSEQYENESAFTTKTTGYYHFPGNDSDVLLFKCKGGFSG